MDKIKNNKTHGSAEKAFCYQTVSFVLGIGWQAMTMTN